MDSEILANRFRLISRLGEGGMGVTYRAWDERDGRPVVIKQPHRSLLSTAGIIERFAREIRTLAALSHPHVVPIIDHGLHDGVPFAAMRLLPGGSLSNRRLRAADGTPRPNHPATLHLWLPSIAAALDFIHSAGVVHRDVKPSNIFFDAWWDAFLGDFGIAKVVAETSLLNPDHTLTSTNMALGTMDYMAPELFRPQHGIDGRADQYALAIVIYEMLAARKPFCGERAHLIVEHASFPPAPLATLVSGLPSSLYAAVHRGLAKQPDDRFASCFDFATAALCDVPPLAQADEYARLLCPKCETILKLPPNAENQLGSCTRCKAVLTVAAGFEALWLPQEAAAVADLPTPSEAEWSEATPIPPGQTRWPATIGPLSAMLRAFSWCRTARPPRYATTANAVAFVSVVLLLLWLALLVDEPLKEARTRFILSGWVYEPRFEELDRDLSALEGLVVLSGEFVNHPMITEEYVFIEGDNATMGIYSGPSTHVPILDEIGMASDLLSINRPSGSASGAFACRTDPKMRTKLVQTGGGSAQSEAAVETGIKWIINHQLPDGSWDFDHVGCPECDGKCTNPGTFRDHGGATALALLPLLGRGYSHKEGPYKKQVEAGIGFLAALTTSKQGKSYEKRGNLYSQGLAGIALAEVYAMTQDKRLSGPAQLALNYIMAAQDPEGGGWRYAPKQPGDTSATGWQLTALKAGHEAFLQVSPLAIKKAVEFLNRVQDDDGATYGYAEPGDAFGTSAVGLLCRMRLGWKKDNPALQRGVRRLAREGPTADLYYNYYATQVLHNMEGDMWVAWNTKMRNILVKAQEKDGHEEGSWWDGFEQGHAPQAGGRLYTTAMATMILEVYYRYTPLYARPESTTEFKE
jgi:serine/threonine protein kinase